MGTGESGPRARPDATAMTPTRASGSGRAASPVEIREANEACDASAAAPTPARPAPLGGFARYRIDGEIGHGGMGVVLLAWDFDLDRAVAMKVLHDFIDADDRFAARFIEEAQVAARLQHPAVVPIYDVGTNPEGKMYFTMKLIEGLTLSEVVAKRGDEEEVLPLPSGA